MDGSTVMPDESRYTVDHEEIRRWAERRGGRPAALGRARGRITGLRVDFPEYRIKAAFQRITWDRFFDAFETARWGFVYHEKTGAGQLSHFYRFVERDQQDRACARADRELRSPRHR